MKSISKFAFAVSILLATATFAQDDTVIETVMESPVAIEQPAEQPLAQDSETVEQPPPEIPVPPPPPPQPKLEISAPLPQPKQDTVSSDKNAEKGFYLKLGGGYAFGTGKTSGSEGLNFPAQSTVSESKNISSNIAGYGTTSENSSKTTKKNEPFSIGEGIQFGIGIGYMFNKNIGIELNGDYLSSSYTVENKSSTDFEDTDMSVPAMQFGNMHSTTSSSSNSEIHSLNRTSLTLTPALRLVAPINDEFSLYSRIGVAVPILDDMVYEYEKNSQSERYSSASGSSETSSSSANSENKEQEFTSYFALGYSAALGVSYALGKSVNVFAEVSSNTMSFEVKTGKITKWKSSTTTNGNTTNSDLLANMSTSGKETDYQKEITTDNNNPSTPSSSDPKKEISFSLPASNVGISVGLMFRF